MTSAAEEWRTYDEFAAGIDTYRLPPGDLSGQRLRLHLDDDTQLVVSFDDERTATWHATGTLSRDPRQDPYDAIAVRDDVWFVNLPLTSSDREAITIVYSSSTHQGIVVRSLIAARAVAGEPQVGQTFWAATLDGAEPVGPRPAPSRDLIGKRNVYRYSPHHLYEHVYISSGRYAWQCLEGVQRGHGDMDLSTVWKLADGLYLFCFREFRIPVASAWLHDLGYQLMTTGVFLGLDGDGRAEHSRAGGHIYPLGTVSYPDVQPV